MGSVEHKELGKRAWAVYDVGDEVAFAACLSPYRAWSDSAGDVESVFSKDELLTNLTIYWATETIGSSFRPYWDSRNNPDPTPWVPITVPCGIAVFPRDLGKPPREFAERSYNVRGWTEMPRGGHFAALEEPELPAQDIRAFFRKCAEVRLAVRAMKRETLST